MKKNNFWKNIDHVFFISLLLLLTSQHVYAETLLTRCNLCTRHQIQLLNDYQAINSLTTTWPFSVDAATKALSAFDSNKPQLITSVEMIKNNTHLNSYPYLIAEYANRSRNDATLLKDFSEKPRYKEQISLLTTANLGSLSSQIHYSLGKNPTGLYENNWDESSIDLRLGNWSVSVEQKDLWWGPTWDGNLIMSNSARPVPKLMLRREVKHPFESKWLSWMGPWHLETFVGEMESNRHIPNALLFGMRAAIKPLPQLEFGGTRAAQFGGDGRPVNLATIARMLVGFDNTNEDGITKSNQPGNQLAGLDIRWNSSVYPYALYWQVIGEDESNGIPTARMHQAGIEHWGVFGNSSYRTIFEYTDTTHRRGWTFNTTGYNVSYNHGVYRSGYRYYDQPIGYSGDNDNKVRSFILIIDQNDGRFLHAIFRNGHMNIDNAGQNPVFPTAQYLNEFAINYSFEPFTNTRLSIGYERSITDEISTSILTDRNNLNFKIQYSID